MTAGLTCFLLALGVGLLALGGSLQVPSGWLAAVQAGLIVFSILIPVLGWRNLGSRATTCSAVLHPPVMLSAYCVTLLGIPGLAATLFPEALGLSEHAIDTNHLVAGWALLVAGQLLLWITYVLSFRVFAPRVRRDNLSWRYLTPWVVATGYGLGAAVLAVYTSAVGVQYGADTSRLGEAALLSRAVTYVAQTRHVALAAMALFYFSGKRGVRTVFLCAVLFEVATGLSSGMMKPVFWSCIIVALSIVVARGTIRGYRKHICFAFALASVSIPVAQTLRTQDGAFSSTAPLETLAEAWTIAKRLLLHDRGEAIELLVQKASSRQVEVASGPGMIISQTPSRIPYQGWAGFTGLVSGIIPRVLWPDKPTLNQGRDFSVVYRGISPEIETASAMTVFGEGYMFSGWPGACATAVILGIIMSIIQRSSSGGAAAPLLLALLPIYVDIEDAFTQRALEILQACLVYYLFYRLLAALSRSKKSEGGYRHFTSLPAEAGLRHATSRDSKH